MTTHIIILAQGTQQRLVGVDTPKQLLRLPACGDATILGRTIRLLRVRDVGEIAVVTWERVSKYLHLDRDGLGHELEDPGNSSLKGISRYLNEMYGYQFPHPTPVPDHFVVLLGDVVYSHSCLRTLLRNDTFPVFAVTRKLDQSSGELWGISWPRASHMSMLLALQAALAHHPPKQFDDTYQPGQLRNWLFQMEKLHTGLRYFPPEDDYTMDVDLPEHIKLLPDVSVRARADDLAHGVVW